MKNKVRACRLIIIVIASLSLVGALAYTAVISWHLGQYLSAKRSLTQLALDNPEARETITKISAGLLLARNGVLFSLAFTEYIIVFNMIIAFVCIGELSFRVRTNSNSDFVLTGLRRMRLSYSILLLFTLICMIVFWIALLRYATSTTDLQAILHQELPTYSDIAQARQRAYVLLREILILGCLGPVSVYIASILLFVQWRVSRSAIVDEP